MLPGKVYTPPDFLVIARKWAWVWVLPLAVASVLATVYARSLPNMYRSESTILVVPQRVPEAYVRSTVTTRIEDRLPTIQQQILSRTRLERTIQEFDLYAPERRTEIMEDVIQRMRGDISVNMITSTAFRVSYVGPEPVVVMKVTQRLASMFIEESLRQRGVLAEGTTEFLDSQLEETRRQLVDKEQKRAAYYKEHSGELPSQLESNLQQVGSVRMQIQQLVESMNRDQDNLLSLERQLAEAASSPAGVMTAAELAGEGAPAGSLAEQLAAARGRAEALTARLRPGHPDLEAARRLVRDLEQRLEADALQTSVSGPAAATSPLEAERQRRMATLQERIRDMEKQTTLKKAEEQRLRSVAAALQQRIDVIPNRQTELTELERDYGTIVNLYTSLLTKKEDARISANLERRQVGEQFQLLDPARVAERPISPNRQALILMGMAIGLAIGFAIVGLLEYSDSTFKTDEEVAAILRLPVLAVVPVMRSIGEEQRALRRRLLAGIAVGGAAACSLGVLVYALAFAR